MKVIWKCIDCNYTTTSCSSEKHKLDTCYCRKSHVDLEEYYMRLGGHVVILERIKD